MNILQIHPSDDMAVALTHLKAGQVLELNGTTISLRTPVPAKYKVYLRDLPEGAHPKLYGMPAGRTTKAVQRGEVAIPDNLAALRQDAAALMPELASWKPPSPRGLLTTFHGYRRPDGSVGTRNHLLVIYTVICTRQTAERVVSVARRAFGFEPEDPWLHYARDGILPPRDKVHGYPGIDEIVLLHHNSGCGMADHGDPEALLDFMAGYVRHPNGAGAIVLGLGCEKTPIQKLRTLVGQTWKPVVYLSHQSCGNEEVFLQSALDALKEMPPITPVIKVSTNSDLALRMPDLIDFDAGTILQGESLEETGRRMYELAVEVASGRKTANERLGHRESAFWNRQVML